MLPRTLSILPSGGVSMIESSLITTLLALLIWNTKANTKDKSLAEMCKAVLNKRLPKSKEKLSKNQKKKRKAGRRTPTAHWRRKDITKEMKEYAANDVACGIDVWMKLKTDTVDDEDETLSSESSS